MKSQNTKIMARAIGYFYLVGALGLATTTLAQSDPRAQWHLRHEFPRLLPPLQSSPPRGIAFGNNVWVAVGGGGTVLTTPDPDLLPWTSQTSGTANQLIDVLFANGAFIAAGSSGTILISTNGVDWVTQPSGTTSQINQIIYAPGQYVAVGASGLILTSADGRVWNTIQSQIVDSLMSGVAYGNGTYVAASPAGLWLSNDLETWRRAMVPGEVNRVTSLDS